MVAGSEVQVPEPEEVASTSGKQLAYRMHQIGPEACAAAIGGLPPKCAAASLSYRRMHERVLPSLVLEGKNFTATKDVSSMFKVTHRSLRSSSVYSMGKSER